MFRHRKRGSEIARQVETCEISAETFRKWESGQNTIDLLWIPAICEVGECDVAFLFGEYETRRKDAADICAETGLSKEAVQALLTALPVCRSFLDALLRSPDHLFEIASAYAAHARAKMGRDSITADYTRFELQRAIIHFTEQK